MTKQEKAIREFCGQHADWWPSITQVQEMLALAQPEQEPVAWMDEYGDVLSASVVSGKGLRNIPLYTAPPEIEVGCAECGVNGGHALYCVECAEKFVGEAATKLQQKQETIEGLNRDYDLLFAEHQLLLKKEWVGLMRGVRVEGDTLVITVKGGNDAARELCGALIEEMNK